MNKLAIVRPNDHSGAEDISAEVLRNRANRAATDAAINRGRDRDAIVAAALTTLHARANAFPGNQDVYIGSYAHGVTGRYINPDDVSGLMAEIRTSLSPVVR